MDETPQPPAKPPKRELSVREIEARRANAQHSTGPRTDEGKATSSRNAWKHGLNSSVANKFRKSGAESIAQLFGKPCLRTCPIHPDNPSRTVAPCSLVVDGLTNVGGNCLDKGVYVDAFAALMDAMQHGSLGGMHALLASEGAAFIEILGALRREISERGLGIPQYAVTKEGVLVRDDDGAKIVIGYTINPALAAATNLLDKLGISLPEMLATPQAESRKKTDEKNADTGAKLLGSIYQRAGLPQPPRALPQGMLSEDAE